MAYSSRAKYLCKLLGTPCYFHSCERVNNEVQRGLALLVKDDEALGRDGESKGLNVNPKL